MVRVFAAKEIYNIFTIIYYEFILLLLSIQGLQYLAEDEVRKA